jgi:hypothetical protein
MRNILTIIFFELVFNNYSIAQISLEKFILSFSLLNEADSILISSKEVFGKQEIAKLEALKYVYHDDTALLTCNGVYYDMIHEKITGKWSKIKLPKRSFRIEKDSLIIIAYTSYNCKNPDDTWSFLNLDIYSKKYQLKDKLIAYKGNDDDYEISSLINTKSLMIFLYRYNTTTKMKEFYLYKVNQSTHHFDLIKTFQTEKISTDNLRKTIEKIGFLQLFTN